MHPIINTGSNKDGSKKIIIIAWYRQQVPVWLSGSCTFSSSCFQLSEALLFIAFPLTLAALGSYLLIKS
ncbi:hypothetical protein CapIbe_011263 [Capra ibex]